MTRMLVDRAPIPDPSIIAEVIRLAEESEDERHARQPPEHAMSLADDLERYLQPRPRWRALLDYLTRLPDEAVAGWYSIYRLGDRPRSLGRAAARRYLNSYDIAIQPIHSEHGAADLAAKGPLADGLRNGLEGLGLELEPRPREEPIYDTPKTPERTPR